MSALFNEVPSNLANNNINNENKNDVSDIEFVTIPVEKYEQLKQRSKYVSKKLSNPRPRKPSKPNIIKQLEQMEKDQAKLADKPRVVRRVVKKKTTETEAPVKESTPAHPTNITMESFEQLRKELADIRQLHTATALELQEEKKRKEQARQAKEEKKAQKKKQLQEAGSVKPTNKSKSIKSASDRWEELNKNANIW